MAMDTQILMPIGQHVPIVTVRMHSRTMRRNGAMKTTMDSEVIRMETTQTIVQTKLDLQQKIGLVVQIVTVMATPTRVIHSQMMVHNGRMLMVTTTAITQMVTILTSSPTMHPNGEIPTAMDMGTTPGGTNGDRFPNDATQWSDADNDGYGDNFVDVDGDGVSEGKSDVCPQVYGESSVASSRGCPDSDGDGYTDPDDAFPDQPLQWADQDGDGFGDNTQFTDGDRCIDVYGKSTENGMLGCPDSDGDGHADPFGDFVANPDCTGADAFPDDPLQWCDKDGDGVGDNYQVTNKTVIDEDNPGLMIEICDHIGDAFPNDVTQSSDIDCDGRGDNSTGIAPDAFPLRKSQQDDNDGDGYGNNITNGAYQSDECRNEYGTSTIDRFGCPDSDDDGMSDLNDPCIWDPAISTGIPGQVECSITENPNKADEGETVAEVESKSSNTMLYAMGGIIAFMLAAILVAMLARQASRNKMMRERAIERKAEEQLMDEDERREQWIDYYVANGDFDKARELGWVDPASLPAWKQHEIQQQEALQASIPSMLDLD